MNRTSFLGRVAASDATVQCVSLIPPISLCDAPAQIEGPQPRNSTLAEAISRGTPGEAAPEALLSALRVEETRRKGLEEQLATLPQSTAAVSLDRDRVARELRTRADDVVAVLRRQGEQAREALQRLLVDRVDCTPVLLAGERGYAFTGDGTFGGLLAASTWPTTFGGPNGTRTRVYSPSRASCSESGTSRILTQFRVSGDSNSEGGSSPSPAPSQSTGV